MVYISHKNKIINKQITKKYTYAIVFKLKKGARF
jgi:hypothetical protein